MIPRILSLDIASTTGWAFVCGDADKNSFKFGLIKTKVKDSRAQKLVYFREELLMLLNRFRPTHVVIEGVYAGPNTKTLVLLSKFAGVAEECCLSVMKIEAYIIHTSTVKSYFKAKNKEQVFNFIVDIFDWDSEKVSFKKCNDITDALAQLVCYYDTVLKCKKFREKTEYGYLYEV